MMMSATAFSSSSSSSSGSAIVRVDKATSEFLNAPDWTINIDICDTINSNHWLAKDVVKAVKKRLQHKNPNVQLLSLTLLETMVKNCGDRVHFQIVERNVLPEMIKIVKKKTDMRVREKILVLLDSWQEAFGSRGGKYPQYYFAYEELRHSGVEFPHRSPDASPIFTPPITHPSFGHPQAGHGMPINASLRLDEAMASEIENLSLSMIESMKSVSDLLSDMLQAVDVNDRSAVKDEVIVDIVDRCRSNQKKLMQMLSSISDEELLGQGLELNDNLQIVLAKHDAIASGSLIPLQITSSMTPPPDLHRSRLKNTEDDMELNSKSSDMVSASPLSSPSRNEADEEEDDDFALLARRHSKTNGVTVGVVTTANSTTTATDPSSTLALALTDPPPPPPANTMRAEDMIDFLSLTLSSTNSTPESQSQSQTVDQTPPSSVTPSTQPHAPLTSYVVPWAQPPAQSELSSGYIPPPWAATPGYYNHPYPSSSSHTYSALVSAAAIDGDGGMSSSSSNGAAQKPFIPSYRLFEDLNVLGNSKISNNLPGNSSSQSIGKK